ncbi:NUDIX domain-containing protein [Bacillus sporothermodurans]|nr:NUDIX domain-containing protein [Heyndrickxia sporothermodurans]MBL5798459.1 NUDIX domain-containing protein [Heyndrickxia sporothermodurans]MBL5809376.1 NUDIX domain-containing protein [Heyndrickxia sporothermodurans]MBL5813011.1 NUDIX domain-containing protein [Heyndrickxia sporothermodurans]MBL5816435.1 NUDIX domain-containing protein [Heyndrickxia sporothermodurans]MBL5841822.1 NUDIX domain-containing protein [Heyndrickxia sporothermodurans]
MDYCENMRQMIGNSSLIIVRPSVAIVNHYGEILLSRYSGATWGIPGGILQLNESVEDCITRKVFQEIGLKIKELKLFGVYSGKELINRVEESGDEYQTVAIGYLCTKYEGEITPESNQGIEAQFFGLDHLPDEIDPFIKDKLVGVKGQLEKK